MADDPYTDTYTESQVILTSVRILAPFTMTYGLFLTLHGADTPGGGFQGGAIVGVTILMLAFGFGIEPTRQWLRNSLLVGLATGGVAIFAAVGLATIALGGNFLEYEQFDQAYGIAGKWGMEAVEIGGIGLIVSSVVIALFFVTAAGFPAERRSEATLGGERAAEPAGSEPTMASADTATGTTASDSDTDTTTSDSDTDTASADDVDGGVDR